MWTRRNMTLVGLIEAALIAAVTMLFIWPRYTDAQNVKRQALTLEAKMMQLEEGQRAVERLATQVAAAQRRVEEGFKSIPESPEVADLIRKLSFQIDDRTVLDQTFTAGSAAEAVPGGKSLAMSMPVTADMQATFDSVFSMIENAESMKRLVRVASLRILCKRDDKTPDTPIVNASIGLEAIFQPPMPKEGPR